MTKHASLPALSRRKFGIFVGASFVVAAIAKLPGSDAWAATSELEALHLLMKQVIPKLYPEQKESASHFHRNGYWESQEMKCAWLGFVKQILSMSNIDSDELVTYWASRAQEDTDDQFAKGIYSVIESDPALSKSAIPLLAVSKALSNEVSKYDSAAMDGKRQTAAERDLLDVDGKRRSLMEQVRQLLQSVGQLTPANPTWSKVLRYLQQDADKRWTAAALDRVQKRDVATEMTKTFIEAMGDVAPPGALKITLSREPLKQKLISARVSLLEVALSPRQTPTTFLNSDVALAYVKLQILLDADVVEALKSPIDGNSTWIVLYDGLYTIRDTFTRREAYLKLGSEPVSVLLLASVASTVAVAENWDWVDFDPKTGSSMSKVAAERAAEIVDLVNRYVDSWISKGELPRTIYAAADINPSGDRVWTHLNWLGWKWLSAEDVDDLILDRRVVNSLGRRWLLPAGTLPPPVFRTFGDVRAANAREIIVALPGN